jgi:arginase family enzyme
MNKSRFTEWRIVSILKQADVDAVDDQDFPSTGYPACDGLQRKGRTFMFGLK